MCFPHEVHAAGARDDWAVVQDGAQDALTSDPRNQGQGETTATVNTIRGTVPPDALQNSAGFLGRFNGWMNQVADAFFGPVVGDAHHCQPAEAYLFLNPSYCAAAIDSNQWDLLTDQRSQWEIEDLRDV